MKVVDGKEEPKTAPVRPLRYINKNTQLPMKGRSGWRVRKVFADEWKPVLSFMHEESRGRITSTSIDDMKKSDFIDETYEAGVERLKRTYPSLFEGDNVRIHKYYSNYVDQDMLFNIGNTV